MWYFTWILCDLLAASFGVINVMWLEAEGMDDEDSCTGSPEECSQRPDS